MTLEVASEWMPLSMLKRKTLRLPYSTVCIITPNERAVQANDTCVGTKHIPLLQSQSKSSIICGHRHGQGVLS